jgi:hypothetical protein
MNDDDGAGKPVAAKRKQATHGGFGFRQDGKQWQGEAGDILCCNDPASRT